MKKIDKLVLGAFTGPFLMTFLVVVFILLTQHMLKYFDDIIGKGLGGEVISQLLFYFAIFMTPVALPLAVLLSSLIAFGNLGEHFELTAIKSAGISLVRILWPIFFFVVFLTGVAFYANNNLVPKAALEAYSLLFDIKQKKPALDLREGAFYNGISDISIKVDKKFPDGITLKNVVVYDHRKNDGNKEVIVADSGKMYTILNESYLKFELFDGYQYSEGGNAQRDMTGQRKPASESLYRSRFSKSQIVFDLSSFQFERTEKKFFQGNRIMRNLTELESDMDSIRRQVLSQRLNYFNYRPSYFSYYFRRDNFELPAELAAHKKYEDSLSGARYRQTFPSPVVQTSESVAQELQDSSNNQPDTSVSNTEVQNIPNTAIVQQDQAPVKKSSPRNRRDGNIKRLDRLKNASVASSLKSQVKKKKNEDASGKVKPINRDSVLQVVVDSVFIQDPTRQNYQSATNAARQVKTNIMNSNASAASFQKEMIIFQIQWHKILASSMACIAMFLIGAPLGAIIKKGGLGMPFLVSILFFIIYYVLTMQGEKLAKAGTLSPAIGVWMADFILFIIGLLFLRQAKADARLFEADFYNVVIDKVRRWFAARKKEKSLQGA